jgi:hypothetical protein
MTSMIGIFGERSLLAMANSSANATDAATQICNFGRMPFSAFHGYGIYKNQCSNLTGNKEADSEVLTSIILKFMNTTFRSDHEPGISQCPGVAASV